jgi:ABC-2 type transport system ATP-binding protein
MMRELRAQGVTIILTTHYIGEAEEMADRVGVISRGALILVEEKRALMDKLGKRELTLTLAEPLAAVPPELAEWDLELRDEGNQLLYTFDAKAERTGIASLIRRITDLGISFKDLATRQSSLEDIFVQLVHDRSAS